ncbi:hypothetical protein ACFE04_012329 [Oxalis oulophora]
MVHDSHLHVVENGKVIAMLDITKCRHVAIPRMEKHVQQEVPLLLHVKVSNANGERTLRVKERDVLKVTFAAGKHGICYIWDHRGEKGSEVYQTYKKIVETSAGRKNLPTSSSARNKTHYFYSKTVLSVAKRSWENDGHELNDSNPDDEHELKLRIIAMKIYKTITQTYWQLIQETSFYGIIRDAFDSSLATMTKIMVIESLKQFLQKDKSPKLPPPDDGARVKAGSVGYDKGDIPMPGDLISVGLIASLKLPLHDAVLREEGGAGPLLVEVMLGDLCMWSMLGNLCIGEDDLDIWNLSFVANEFGFSGEVMLSCMVSVLAVDSIDCSPGIAGAGTKNFALAVTAGLTDGMGGDWNEFAGVPPPLLNVSTYLPISHKIAFMIVLPLNRFQNFIVA